MAASYPTSIKSFTTKTNNVDDVDAAHINDLQDEVVAIETALGAGKASSILQIVTTKTSAMATGSGTVPNDDTIPQIGEGNEFFTLAITPKAATSKLLFIILVHMMESTNTANVGTVGLFETSIDANNALAVAVAGQEGNAGYMYSAVPLTHVQNSPGTSALTFRVRGGVDAGPTTFNGINGARKFGGAAYSSMTIIEFK